MSITSLVTKFFACIAAIAMAASVFADTEAPTSVHLSNGRELQQDGKRIVEVDGARHRTSAVQLPTTLRRAVTSASSIGFPSATSKVLEGKEFVLVVVNQSSSNHPMGFCGAGEEGTLYALQIKDSVAVSAYSMVVQSCLHSVSLDTDVNNRSPYLAIEWLDDSAGFKISWTNIDDSGPATREYRYNGNTFVENRR
ncbi:hypothetical protein Bsp3421_000979 [Burkholderia sp. FERM BP-3421]|jgi:hypothetical protein|uniref:hypothetical protein n=1 Tax=Burkholderia sp. FERM BP-3421 TaxID=1494466 RepID=UPI00236170DE|nr:hypothetical protein [Burkholderia sp. FERM BP-3421]WDD91085.1 hypothetical protein Bsp3421_000979 [Burkholderia sp. FERM BP-3421]